MQSTLRANPCMSYLDAIEPFGCTIRTAADGERSVVATAAFRPGDVIWREQPFAVAVLARDETCNNCLKRTPGGTGMQRCTACKAVKYCCKECQVIDWKKSHKQECPGLKRLHEHNMPEAALCDILLVGKTLRRFAGSAKKGLPTVLPFPSVDPSVSQLDLSEAEAADATAAAAAAAATAASVAKGGSDGAALRAARRELTPGLAAVAAMQTHVHQVMADPGRAGENSQMAAIIAQHGLLPGHCTADQAHTCLCAFQVNNFCIADGILTPIAAGVYPYGALLNHSCDPTAMLMYDEGGSWCQIIRAVKPIAPGDEITHAYIDSGAATVRRRKDMLRETYYFDCVCPRCRLDHASRWGAEPEQRLPPALLESISVSASLDDRMQQSDPWCSFPDTHYEALLSSPPDEKAKNALEQATRMHQEAEAEEDIDKEAQLLASVLDIRTKLLHPLHLDLLRTYSNVSGVAMLRGDMEMALRMSDRIMGVYRRMYHPFHPLTGLQAYTKADLHIDRGGSCKEGTDEKNRHAAAALEAWIQAYAILRVSHGLEHSITQDCARVIQKAGGNLPA